VQLAPQRSASASAWEAGREPLSYSIAKSAPALLCPPPLDTPLRGMGILSNHAQLQMSFGHQAADIKESIVANQCGSTEAPAC